MLRIPSKVNDPRAMTGIDHQLRVPTSWYGRVKMYSQTEWFKCIEYAVSNAFYALSKLYLNYFIRYLYINS